MMGNHQHPDLSVCVCVCSFSSLWLQVQLFIIRGQRVREDLKEEGVAITKQSTRKEVRQEERFVPLTTFLHLVTSCFHIIFCSLLLSSLPPFLFHCFNDPSLLFLPPSVFPLFSPSIILSSSHLPSPALSNFDFLSLLITNDAATLKLLLNNSRKFCVSVFMCLSVH